MMGSTVQRLVLPPGCSDWHEWRGLVRLGLRLQISNFLLRLSILRYQTVILFLQIRNRLLGIPPLDKHAPRGAHGENQ